ncbi:hypothetical protein Cs7R123_70770 [Catellatospora sp. TT07R-123]|uniref:DUF2752 domain-containing protein n=1 Tax=Catellatospora sp. TT07R-123 TaxID=2733863 RepID=UPI001B2B47C9|nr:DUF2752 domain-containing protein [Catellatospora sp. TT07R-123]GHJ49735.1 hypothetical protein Cs7R123_70770 [Catellatospora sp. TT07R-123]
MTEAPAYPDAGHFAPPPADRSTRFVEWMRSHTPRWVMPLAALGCIGGALGYTALVDPTNNPADATPTCLVKLLTGFDCPGCGGTRAAWYLMHGDLPAAARHHLLFVFAVPFMIYMYVAWAGNTSFGWKLPQLKVTPRMIGIFLGAWGVFMVLRNLPWAPFTYFFV